MWVARNQNGALYFFINRPSRIKQGVIGCNYWEDKGFKCFQIDGDLFPEVEWDDEPIEVEIIKKLYNHSDVCVGCHNDNCDNCKYKFKD